MKWWFFFAVFFFLQVQVAVTGQYDENRVNHVIFSFPNGLNYFCYFQSVCQQIYFEEVLDIGKENLQQNIHSLYQSALIFDRIFNGINVSILFRKNSALNSVILKLFLSNFTSTRDGCVGLNLDGLKKCLFRVDFGQFFSERNKKKKCQEK